jgi:polyene glycosyltransferase
VDRPDVMDTDDVHAKLLRLLTEDSFGARARHFAQVQHDAGGLDRAAELILDQVES